MREESEEKLIRAIKHYQDSLERHIKTGIPEKLLHAIEKLSKLPIEVSHLEETGVGRTVNSLKKFEGSVGDNARCLVDKWKSMVQGEENAEKARLEKMQEENVETEEMIEDDEIDPDSLQIMDPEPNSERVRTTTPENINSSHRKSSSKETTSSCGNRELERDKSTTDKENKKSRRHSSSDNSEDSDSDTDHDMSKYKRKSKNSKDSSESDESDSSRESSPKRQKSKRSKSSSSESSSGSDENSSDESSDEDNTKSVRKNKKRHSSESESDKEPKPRDKHNNLSTKYSKSHLGSEHRKSRSSESGSDKESKSRHKHNKSSSKHSTSHSSKEHKHNSKERHSDSKDKRTSHSKSDKRDKDRESSSKKDSSSSKSSSSKIKSETDPKHKMVNKETSKSHDSDKYHKKSSKSEDKEESKEENSTKSSHSSHSSSKSSHDRKRPRDPSTERESKKQKSDSHERKETKSKDYENASSSSKSKKSSDKKKETPDKHKSDSDRNRKLNSGSSSSSSKNKSKDAVKTPVTNTSKTSSSSSKKLLEGIDSESGTSFADVLGMLEAPVYKSSKKKSVAVEEKKRHSEKLPASSKEDKPKSKTSATEVPSPRKSNEMIPNLLQDSSNLEPLDINIQSLLPAITPNYKPLSHPLDSSNKKLCLDEETFRNVITAKHQRTKVYSGNKSGYTKVPTLFDLCSRILQDNLDALEYTGGVPYSILKPILEKANPNQLYQLEFHNPYLIEDSDELWKLHCQKEFRNKTREELECWREMYLRCLDEREAKLKALTANIKFSQEKSIPVRQTKLAYMDSVVKPPRNIARKQAKNGTAVDIKRPSLTPSERAAQLVKAGEASKVAVPNPSKAAPERSRSTQSAAMKPKKAPLMAKTLSLLKNRFGRR